MNIRSARIIAASEAMVETPNDLEVRKRFCMATFNLDHLAAAIIELSRSQDLSGPQGTEAAISVHDDPISLTKPTDTQTAGGEET
jgi:hypothetical protein